MSAKKASVELNESRAMSSTANASTLASASVVSSESAILTDGFASQARMRRRRSVASSQYSAAAVEPSKINSLKCHSDGAPTNIRVSVIKLS